MLALERHPVQACASRPDLAGQLDRPAKQQQFPVKIALPASGCEVIATVRRRKISSSLADDAYIL
jgi:hypothetical protein